MEKVHRLNPFEKIYRKAKRWCTILNFQKVHIIIWPYPANPAKNGKRLQEQNKAIIKFLSSCQRVANSATTQNGGASQISPRQTKAKNYVYNIGQVGFQKNQTAFSITNQVKVKIENYFKQKRSSKI